MSTKVITTNEVDITSKRKSSTDSSSKNTAVDETSTQKCKKRKVYTKIDMYDNIPTEKNSEGTFTYDSKKYEGEKESLHENETAYASKCVEFLDTLDFDDEELCEETLNYIDASI